MSNYTHGLPINLVSFLHSMPQYPQLLHRCIYLFPFREVLEIAMSSFVLAHTQIGRNKFKSLSFADSIRYCQQTSSYVYLLYCVCIAVFFTLDAGLRARSQYSEGPATGHLDTGFSRFPYAYKQTLRRFPTFQVATTCFSCSPPDLNLLLTNFM